MTNQTHTPGKTAPVDYKEIIRKSAKHLLCIHGSVEGWDTQKDRLGLESLTPIIADLVAALEACKRVDEISSMLRYIEKRRSDGSFAIAVSKDPDAIEWQVLRDEQLKLLSDREAALAKARGETN